MNPAPPALAGLHPGYFALVMATGILSIAAFLLGLPGVPQALLYANICFFVILCGLTLARLFFFLPLARADLADPARGPGFFTTVAATAVLGSQLAIVAKAPGPATALLIVGLLLWGFLVYAFFLALMIRPEKPAVETGLHGGWFVLAVATQSISVLASILAPSRGTGAGGLLFLALAFFLLGGFFYLALAVLVLRRLVFLPLAAPALGPAYWVSMGAAAISTLAGARLLLDEALFPLLGELDGFLKAATLFFWVLATWWLPLLLALGFWRHLVQYVPLRYESGYWSLVFPLGMYATCSLMLARATGLVFLLAIPRVGIWIGLGAWLLSFAAMVRDLAARLRRRAF
jgi:tellurite resistance protein TehA-like permease